MLPSISAENSIENPFDSTTDVNSPATHSSFLIDKRIIHLYGFKIGVYGISIYNVLCCFADPVGSCSPSVAQIAKTIGCSNTTVRRGLNQLKAYGLIDIISSYNRDGGQDTNQYRVRSLDNDPGQNQNKRSKN